MHFIHIYMLFHSDPHHLQKLQIPELWSKGDIIISQPC